MCKTYAFYHICGHIYRKKHNKCSEEIEHQLNSLESDDEHGRPTPTGTRVCRDDGGGDMFLKPTLCSTCEKFGIIGDWLNNNPGQRYQIVKEWYRCKHGESAHATSTASSYTRIPSPARSETNSTLTLVGGCSSNLDRVISDDHTPAGPTTCKQGEEGEVKAVEVKENQAEIVDVINPLLNGYISKSHLLNSTLLRTESKIHTAAKTAKDDDLRNQELTQRMQSIRSRMEAILAATQNRAI